jgi:peptide/nickel transport system substrate-binding protein
MLEKLEKLEKYVSSRLRTRREVLAQIALAGIGTLISACSAAPGSMAAPTERASATAANAPTTAPGASAGTGSPTFAVFGAPQDPGGFNPLLTDNGGSSPVWEFLFEGLVVPDSRTGAPSPCLAQSWEPSPDGLTWTFHIRPNVTWSDGQPFTAADVRFTFDTILDPKTASPRRSALANVAGYATPDPATFQVTLKQAACPFLVTTMLTPIVPKHALEGSTDFNTDEFNSSRPISTGPFMFKEWQRGQQLTLAANPNYWGGRPKIDQWIQRPVRNKQVLVDQLKLGEVDYGSVTPDTVEELSSQPHLNVVSGYNPTVITYIAYNLERPLFQDKRVRQALTHALNRQSIVDTQLYGLGDVLSSPIAPVSWANNPNVPVFAYDVAAAQTLFREAGWAPGPDGILQKDGKAFSFTFTSSNSNPQRLAVVTIAQDAWKKVGVQVQPEVLDPGAFYAKYQQARDYDAIVEGNAAGLTNDPDQSAIWASASIASGTNFVRYRNSEVDRLLAQARALPGCAQADRKVLYDEIQQIIADEQPFTFLYSARTNAAYNKRLHNVSMSPWIGGAPYLAWGAKDWTVSN